jgi:hypothetical protein
LLLQAIDTQSVTPYLYGLFMNIYGDGLGVTKNYVGPWGGFPIPETKMGPDGEPVIMDSDEYNEAVQEFLQKRPLSFSSRIVDPLTFYPDLKEYGGGHHIETGMRSTSETFRSLNLEIENGTLRKVPEGKPYPVDELPPGTPPNVRVTEVWDDEHCAILVDGLSEILIFDNILEESPYAFGFGDPTGVEDPTKEARAWHQSDDRD